MTAIVIPTTTMPGQNPQESGGRLINCFVESLGEQGPSPFKVIRCPGMREFGTTERETFRGAFQVGALAYSAWSGKVVTHTSGGGVGTVLTGSLAGDDGVIFARNNAATPDLVAVSPANGAFSITSTTVSAFSDPDVGAPNSVCFLSGYLIFSYGSGRMRATGVNTIAINSLDTAVCESKPDTLLRVVPRGNTLVAAGSESIEFWGLNDEASGFPLAPITTHERGIIGRYAIGGHEPGFGYGIFFVADDYSVRTLEGYASSKISPPDLDRLIEATVNKDTIQVSCYITQGHPFVVVQSDDWTWEYDVILQRWHERDSLVDSSALGRWRGSFPFKAFDKWLCGNTQNANLFEIVTELSEEDGEPLPIEVITAPLGSFPTGARVNKLSIFAAAGVGQAPGSDPIQTAPTMDVFISHDLGLSWSNPWRRQIGPQGRNPNVTVRNLGLCGPKGIKLKFRFSDPVHFAAIGGDVEASPLKAA
jgi:hypothetical protein